MRWRMVGFYIAVVASLALVVVGLGEVLLFGVAGWLDAATLESLFPTGEAHRFHGLGHGLIGWLFAIAIAAQLWRPGTNLAGALFAVASQLIYTLGTLVSGIFDALALVGIIAFGAVLWLVPRPGGQRFWPLRTEVLLLATPMAVAMLVFAGLQIGEQLSAGPADSHASIGHYTDMAALALMTVMAAVVGASSLPGATLAGWLAVAAALWIGAASVLFASSVSSLGTIGGAGLVAAGLAAGLGLVLAGRRAPRSVAATAQAR